MGKIYSCFKDNVVFFVVIICTFLVKLLFSDTCFFWDSISLISVPANYLYETKFSSLLYPPEINITLATFPQVYTALVWLLFGKNLFVTHLAYSLFVVIFLYQLYRFCGRFVSKEFIPFVYLFVLLDTTISTQVLLLTPDLFLLVFSLWSLNNLYSKKNIQVLFSLFMLATVSDRGMILSGILMLFHFFLHASQEKSFLVVLKKYTWVYIPSICFFLFVVLLQKVCSGYFFVNTADTSPWGNHWQFVDFSAFLKNIVVVFLRCFENGHFVVLSIFSIIFFLKRKTIVYEKSLLLLCGIFVLVMLLCTLPFCNPINTRYFAFLFLVFSVFLSKVLVNVLLPKSAKILFVILLFVNVMSNFIVYPEKMAQSWDSSFAHFPYYELRNEVKTFFDNKNIDYSEVGSAFPLLHSIKDTELIEDDRCFSSIDFEKNGFVVYTNISNLDDEIIDRIKKYPCIKSFQKNGIFMRVYKIH